MEVLSPSPPVLVAPDILPFLPSSALNPQTLTAKLAPLSSGSNEGDSIVVHVAVGRATEKGKVLILWALRYFGCKEVVLVHIHKPSLTIPTMMGNIPAKKASEELVSAHRREEKKQAKRTLHFYLTLCRKAQVKASILLVENDDIAGGLLHLINRHSIRRLIMGTSLDSCTKVKKGFKKASIAAKNAPPFCEIWFVKKGKHIWTKDASEDPRSTELVPVLEATFTPSSSYPFLDLGSERCFHPETGHAISSLTAHLTEGRNRIQTESDQRETLINASSNCMVLDEMYHASEVSSIPTNTLSFPIDAVEEGTSHEINLNDKEENHTPQDSPIKERTQDQALHEAAFEESANYEELERETTEAVNRAKSAKAAIKCENKIRKELKNILKYVRRQQKELTEQRDEAAAELAKATEAIAVLESAVLKAGQHQDEVAEELKLIQASIMSLKIERHKICRFREEARKSSQNAQPEDYEFVEYSEEGFIELSLRDLRNATCDFSESFIIGKGSYGCVYKGELLNKSVAIKKLYPQNMQVLLEFEQEAHKLSKLRHLHLVSLIGVCPEAWSLVFDYMPNGNLHDRLFRRANSTSHWNWQERTCTASEIASAILFLHSCEPNEIIHGALKPENIFFDSDFSCRIGDFGMDKLVLEGSIHCPSFRKNSESTGLFSYSDPEYQRTGRLTPKSDVYSFGIIILQLLTGRPPAGLVSGVRRAMLAGKLSSVLDINAGEWPLSVATRLAEFGLQCCENNSRDRPELTNVVVRELQRLHIMEEQPVPHFFLCPILKEIMHDPHVAADGHTYEGRALRNWIENGHDTSPMTNLKLDDLSLTPNHTLRLAIQEWLSQSSPSSNHVYAGRKLT